MNDNERKQRVMQAMTRHRDRERLADAIAATINQANAEEADALAALARVMERITAIRIGEPYHEWQQRQPDPIADHEIRRTAAMAQAAEDTSPYAAAMAAELSE